MLSPGALLLVLPPESPPALLEALPEDFSVLPELAGVLASAFPLLLSLLADDPSEAPSDLPDDVEAGAEPLRA